MKTKILLITIIVSLYSAGSWATIEDNATIRKIPSPNPINSDQPIMKQHPDYKKLVNDLKYFQKQLESADAKSAAKGRQQVDAAFNRLRVYIDSGKPTFLPNPIQTKNRGKTYTTTDTSITSDDTKHKQPSTLNNSTMDLTFWKSIENSDNPALFKGYLQKFPNGVFALIAEEKLKTLSSKPKEKISKNYVITRADGSHLRKLAKESYKYDLDGDGHIEEVLLLPSGKNDKGDFFSLTVLDKDGGVIWAGSKELNLGDPLVFGEWHFGISLPEVFGNIEGNEALELIAPVPQSDVSPTRFRIFEWKNNAFTLLRTSILMETPVGSGKFPWTSGEQYEGVWISGFQSINSTGEIIVDIIDYQGNADVKMRQAVLKKDASGFVVKHWIDSKKNETKEPIGQLKSVHNVQQLLDQADLIMSQAHRESDAALRNTEAKKALKLYIAASKKGSAKAYYNIGFLYELGNGVKRNNDTAIKYYNKAASMGYIDAYEQIILVQNQFKNYKGAAKTFFKYYKANPTLALKGFDDWAYSPNVLRAIQRELKAAGYYRGSIDGKIGSGTRTAIATYVGAKL